MDTEQLVRHKVTDRRSGEYFECGEEQSLLIAMERTHPGLIKVGCRGGGCGLCKIRVLQGDYFTKVMSRAQVSEQEEQSGYVLACRTYPRSDLMFELAEPAGNK
nr:putative ferredoxin [uncultured bacterium]